MWAFIRRFIYRVGRPTGFVSLYGLSLAGYVGFYKAFHFLYRLFLSQCETICNKSKVGDHKIYLFTVGLCFTKL